MARWRSAPRSPGPLAILRGARWTGPTGPCPHASCPRRLTFPRLRQSLPCWCMDGAMSDDEFEQTGRIETVADRMAAESLIIDVDGFEGPLDLLLTLGRTQKVDLRKISILDLAQQYLVFVEKAKELRIELAADYLVMAAWLAFLKSRLLLALVPAEEGPSGEDLAAHLAFQLERIQEMRDVAARPMARDRLGRDFFARGVPEQMERARRVAYTATLLDLMQGYARLRTRD